MFILLILESMLVLVALYHHLPGGIGSCIFVKVMSFHLFCFFNVYCISLILSFSSLVLLLFVSKYGWSYIPIDFDKYRHDSNF